MAAGKKALDEIIARLGKYFGVVSKSAFLSHAAKGLVANGLRNDGTFELEANNLGETLLSMQEGGLATCDLIRQINESFGPSAQQTEGKTLADYFRITYEQSGFEEAANCIAVHGHTAGAKRADQGTDVADGIYSIRKVLGGLTESNVINKTPSNPNKETSPSLSVVQVFPVTLTPANRDTGSVAILLNAISTLELSRAVPFIDIVSISRTPMLTNTGNGTRISQMSLGQFLLGNDNVSGAAASLAGAVDSAVLRDPPPPLDPSDPAPKKDVFIHPFGTAGMELFTSPQTLVNANEVHNEFDSIEQTKFNTLTGEDAERPIHAGGKRATPVIDRFRPLMSLREFKVSVASTGFGMMGYKSADLVVVLHDRSRLAEVAAFVKPDAFNRNHFLIEYGWAHPDNKVHEFRPLGSSTNLRALEDDLSANLMGLFLSHMRCKEKYHVVNSSFSFDEAGQVTINIKLAMLGGQDNHLTNIGSGGEVEEQVKAIRKLTDAVSEIRKKIQSGDGGSEDVLGDGNILNIASSAESATSIKKEDIQKIQKFLSKNKGKSEVIEIETLKEVIVDLLGPKGDGTGAKIGKLKDTIQAEVKRKMEAVKSNYDPWLRTSYNLSDKAINDKNSSEYVSLAKIFTIFLGMPLADTKKFDDVQLYFYAFNEKASFAKDMNIAQFPIKKDDFEKMISNELKVEANMPIGKFVLFFNNAFISDQGAPGYGMTSIFTDRDPENLTKRKIAKKFENDGTAMFGEKQKILKAAYGDGESLDFKLPSLKVKLEAVPATDKTEGDVSSGVSGAEKTILRIHVFDSQASSFTCLSALLSAARRDQMGVVTKSAGNVVNKNTSSPDHTEQFFAHIKEAYESGLLEPIPIHTGKKLDDGMRTPEEAAGGKSNFRIKGGFPSLKNFIMRTMPSAKYGSQNSGILKANVQSMQNALLSTINMQRQGLRPGDEPQSKRDAGVPMTVHPVECSIETIGCPAWEFGQQIFIDFGTGTSIDNMYTVTGIDHSLGPGDFRSSIKLTSNLAWGVYESMVDRVMQAHAVIVDAESSKKSS